MAYSSIASISHQILQMFFGLLYDHILVAISCKKLCVVGNKMFTIELLEITKLCFVYFAILTLNFNEMYDVGVT